jgi:hypothetical protein
MAPFRHLHKRLGWVRAPLTRKYAIDDALHPVLDSLTEQQQSSPAEMVSNRLRRQTNASSRNYHPG